MLALLSLLGACSVKPVEPYSEPPLGVPTAQLRVITNGEVRGEAYAGCQGDSKRLAKAGRFGSDQQANINYPQFPLQPRQIDMLPRFAPAVLRGGNPAAGGPVQASSGPALPRSVSVPGRGLAGQGAFA
ncbi:hypothetical protein M5G25_19255 [Pseudomonas sp. TNT2022 ID357]|uniref:Uncharacterized protein n=1 Tax=Pseudomonas idahonensis TaxID=2942628 RepID=A0ABT5Q896_9PSED|nr:hypothetical protein [Pseudomonas idahonensis]MDD1150420.1 hypothetical protein [Pseudomonas idahonensis]